MSRFAVPGRVTESARPSKGGAYGAERGRPQRLSGRADESVPLGDGTAQRHGRVFQLMDSITHPISPLNPFIYVLLPEARRYDPDFTLGMVFSRMALFVLPVAGLWITILATFYFTGLPLGPGAGIHLGG